MVEVEKSACKWSMSIDRSCFDRIAEIIVKGGQPLTWDIYWLGTVQCQGLTPSFSSFFLDRDCKPRKVDFLKREAANSELGLLGEKFVLKFEKARLIHAGKVNLAEGIEHTSQDLGDGTGYDIRSYEVNGTNRFIEVKTTCFSRYTPFYVTPNELRVSQEHAEKYNLYRVFQLKARPQLFISLGSIEKRFLLEPSLSLAFYV